jgi:adenosylcobinamide kinase/adenosylcobinamide-phosphate guanylyltransferase
MKNKIIFITGGMRSGKTSYAIKLAKLTHKKVTYIATGIKTDKEMKKKIAEHIKSRPENWLTIEEPVDLIKALNKTESPVIVIDCLNFWLANIMRDMKEKKIIEHTEKLCCALKKKKTINIIVSNEVGLSLVSTHTSGRLFQNFLGRVNQIVAKHADEVYLMISGIPVKIKQKT